MGWTTTFSTVADHFSAFPDETQEIDSERKQFQECVEFFLEPFGTLENRSLKTLISNKEYEVDIHWKTEFKTRELIELKVFKSTTTHHYRLKEIVFDILKLRCLADPSLDDESLHKAVIILCCGLEPDVIDDTVSAVVEFANVDRNTYVEVKPIKDTTSTLIEIYVA